MINKKGQIGKGLTIFSVLLVVFLVMGLFNFLAYNIGLGREVSSYQESGNFREDFLFKGVGQNGEIVLDSLLGYVVGDISADKFKDFLQKDIGNFYNEKNNCLFLILKNSDSGLTSTFESSFKDGNVVVYADPLNRYFIRIDGIINSKKNFRVVKMDVLNSNGEKSLIEIKYYFGECKNE